MKRILLLMLSIVMITIAEAGDVTPDEALEHAMSFMQKREATGNRVRKAPGKGIKMKMVCKVSGLYVFNVNNDDGYVIVSGDDRTTPILGFSDSGHVDPDNMPENMKAWLQGYADEIAWMQQHCNRAVLPMTAFRSCSAIHRQHRLQRPTLTRC